MWNVDGILTSDIGEHDKKVAAEVRAERMTAYFIRASVDNSGLNPFLSESINTARHFDNWLCWHPSFTEENRKLYRSLSELEQILEKYAKEEISTNGTFNIFMHTDDKIDELVKKAKSNGLEVPKLSDEAKTLRRKKYNCGNCKPRKIKLDDYDCV